MDAREALELRRRQILERLSPDLLEIQPGYPTAREELLRPDRMEAETAYFWDHWAPRLGASATMLVVRMRQACRRAARPDASPAARPLAPLATEPASAHPSGVARREAAVTLSYQEIGRFCGMSASTVKRLLKQEEVIRFITREAQMRESVIGMVDAPNRYIVMMTDPLTPEDEEILRDRLADRLLTQELLHAAPASHARPTPATHASAMPASTAAFPAPSASLLLPEQVARTVQENASNLDQYGLPTRVQNDPEPPVQNDYATGVQNEPLSQDQIGGAQGRAPRSISALAKQPKPESTPHQSREAAMQNVKNHEERNVNNVPNAPQQTKTPTQAPGGLPFIDSDRLEEWAQRLMEVTGDEKSLNFYRKAVRILLQRNAEGVMDHAMGVVKEAIREGTVRNPGALLTSTLLKLAEERGIYITERSQREATQARDMIRRRLGE